MVLLFLCQVTMAFASGPSYRFEHITIEDGLPQNNVNAVIQDSQGFIWIGTVDGLVRYDGYSLRVFSFDSTDKNSLSGNYITCIYEDSNKILWIGTFGYGLNRFDPKTGEFTHYKYDEHNPDSLSDDDVWEITEDSIGNIWVGSLNGGLNRFVKKTGSFDRFQYDPNDESSISNNGIWALTKSKNGNLWVGTYGGGLNYFNHQTQNFTRFKYDSADNTGMSGSKVLDIIEDQEGNVWLGTENSGLNFFNTRDRKFTYFSHKANKENSLSSDNIKVLIQDKKGNIWIGTKGGGLDRLNPKTHKITHFKNEPYNHSSISSNTILSLLEDYQDNIWVGTDSGGLNRLNPMTEQFSHFTKDLKSSNSLSHKMIRAINEDDSGNLWVGTHGGGLNKIDKKTGKISHLMMNDVAKNSVSSNYIRAITKDRNGELWIGTEGGGLNKLNPKTLQFKKFRHSGGNSNSISHDHIYGIAEDNEGILWIGTYGGGLNKFDPAINEFTHFMHDESDPNSIGSDVVLTIFFDSQDRLWLGTFGGGLNLFDRASQKFTRYKHDIANVNTISSNNVLSVTEDFLGNIWVGTSEGLNLLKRGTQSFIRYNKSNGLSNNFVYRIEEDSNGNIWMSSNAGLSRLDPSTQKIRNFSVADGLQSNEYNVGASYKSPSGILYFGGINGLDYFTPEQIIDPNSSQPIVFTDFLLANESVAIENDGKNQDEKRKHYIFTLSHDISVMDELVLTHQENLITLEFSKLDFINSKRTQYAYLLEGWDSEWIRTDYKNRRATYTNLPSSSYILKVKASDSGGNWGRENASIRITISPPYWQTWWAYFIYATLSLSFVFWFVRFQQNRILFERNLNTQLENKVADRTADIQLLAEVGKEISSNLELEGIIEDVYRHVDKLMDATIFAIGIYRREKQHIEYKQSIENGHWYKPYTRDMKDKNQFAVQCIDQSRAVFIDDIDKHDDVYTSNEIGVLERVISESQTEPSRLPHSYIYIPLILDKEVIGLLTVQSYEKSAYTSHHVDMLQTLATYIVVAIDNANAYQKIAIKSKEVEEKNKEILATQQQLIQSSKMASLGTMTAGVAHEINNPTNFAHAAVYMMKYEIEEIKAFLRQLAGGENADSKVVNAFEEKFNRLIELTNTATEGTTRIKTIVEDLRVFARLDDTNKAKIQLSELLKSTVHLIETQYNYIEIAMNLEFDPVLNCFPSKLNQVFMNTLVNGCQAIQSKIEFDKNHVGKIEIKTLCSEQNLNIVISDNGIGMNKETLERIFEPFFTTKEVGSGTGLGMAISFGIVEEHGGSINVQSAENEGAIFTISLPT